MSTEIYLSGQKANKESFALPLNSCAVIFAIHYCHLEGVILNFVDDEVCEELQITITHHALHSLNINFITQNEVPSLVNVCSLPVLVTSNSNLIRSGLCNVIRQIIMVAHSLYPKEDFKDLLGFRGGSLKACAEVSSWTKLCELEFPEAIMSVITQGRLIKSNLVHNGKLEAEDSIELSLTKEIVILEQHLYRPPRIHNDDKMKRHLIQRVLDTWSDPVTRSDDSDVSSNIRICQRSGPVTGELLQPHAVIRFKIPVNNVGKCNGDETVSSEMKFFPRSDKCNGDHKCNGDNNVNNSKDVEETLQRLMNKMRIDDIILDHLYVEGIEMTVADLMLFVFTYHFIESIDFQFNSLKIYLPKLCAWFQNMTKMPKLKVAALQYGCCLEIFNQHFEFPNIYIYKFILPEVLQKDTDEDENEEESELQRRTRSKYRALKPELARVLKIIKEAIIEPIVGEHPCGTDITLPWSELPRAIHPHEGGLPEKRALKKCQQLENLVTAIRKIAQPGQTIVDFCSGGGHLGIIVASLIPYCKVFLIENKEESLLIAKSRVDKLQLNNVTLYQCNLGYFHGKFDVGTCLHACGVATDMVLQKCLDSKAAFVVCPCCYGAVQNTHLISYPRSQLFQKANISDKDLLTLGHAADQTEVKTTLEQQGRYCMDLVDTDRLQYASEHGYDVILCSLVPQTCTPKNNLLIGTLPTNTAISS
ncbi:Hypothetical predicted protein [Octopus vulgaris]|uniref:Methyltransferase domain-containing protein n=2 Tax=Octopus vulgaris TaxID=6645 RepID=A0AA36BHH0_OCTVU|nr:Hypothetical predicted protein [Octopus vulgaris]